MRVVHIEGWAEWKKVGLAAALLAAGLCLAFAPLWFGGRMVYEDDVTHYYIPAFKFYSDALASGESFQMTPGIFSGFPLALTQVGGFLDPLNYVIFKSLPFLAAYDLRIFLNYFLAGLFTFLFARSLRLSFLASLIAMFAFVTAQNIIPGFNILRSNSFFLMPALFWATQGLWVAAGERQWRRMALYIPAGIAVLVISFLGGYTQLVLYGIMAAFAFAAFLLWQRFSVAFLGALGSIYAAAAIMLLPYFLAVLDLTAISARAGGLDWGSAASTASLPHMFLNLTVNLFLPPWHLGTLQSLYIGSLSVFFFLIAFMGIRKHPLILFFVVLFAFSVLSAFPYPTFWLMHMLPVLELFRYPPHWLVVGSFAMSMLAAIGFEYVQISDKFTYARNFLARVGASGVVALLALNVALPAWVTVAASSVPGNSITGTPWVIREIRAQEMDATDPYRALPLFPSETNNVFFVNRVHTNPIQSESFNLEYIQTHLMPLMWDVDAVRGYDNLVPRRYARVLTYLDSNLDAYIDRQTGEHAFPEHTLSLYGMMNIKYFWTVVALRPSSSVEYLGATMLYYQRQKSDDAQRSNAEVEAEPPIRVPIHLYRNTLFLPRVHAPQSATILPESEGNFSAIIETPNDFRARGFIECNDCAAGLAEQREKVEITGMRFRNDEVSFAASSTSDHWVVVSNSHVPGWHAYIDGVEAPIRYANYVYQGILVPAGIRAVSLRYGGPYAGLFSI